MLYEQLQLPPPDSRHNKPTNKRKSTKGKLSQINFQCVNGQKYLNIWREETARVRQSKVGEK
jgi:hypothetical protein